MRFLPRIRKKQIEDWPWTGAPPPSWISSFPIGFNQAVGLPAFLAVVRLLSSAASMIPLKVYAGEGPGRQEARESWQWQLLHRKPSPPTTSAVWRSDIAASIAANGNAYLAKRRGGGNRIIALDILDSARVTPVSKAGNVVYEDRTGGALVNRSSDDVIHIRTFASPGHLAGVSPIGALRDTIATGIKRGRFEGAYYQNDARPGLAVIFGEQVTEEQALRWLRLYEPQHQGVDRAHSVGLFGGGVEKLEVLPISLQDAQFVEAARLTIGQIAAVYHVPIAFFADASSRVAPTETDRLFLVTFGLGPMLRLIDEALSFDAELFPPGEGLIAEHVADALLRPDTKTRYDAYRLARQGGWVTANEIRALENMPPVSGGDNIQETPVGGAPNP